MPKCFLCRCIVCKALWDESGYIMKMALYSVSFIHFPCSSDVLCFGGDILNSTGDALLVLWKVERSQLSDIITIAAKCSLEMQEQFEFSYTEVGLQLQLKIGMSAGHVSQLIVGDEIRQHLLVTGQQVDDVRLAQAREVILSPNCWELCDRDVLETEMLKGQKAMKVGAVALASSHELELALRRFALGNVLKKVRCCCFCSDICCSSTAGAGKLFGLRLQFHESTKATELCKLVQEATVSISSIMEGWRGKILQISTFGKGCTFLCAFGLPGDKREEESIHALDSAISISNFSFCRVAGMHSRQEYTGRIGLQVKMASRMLTHYPGMISCYEETYSKSGFPSCFFKKLPEKEMSDAVSSGVTYEYLGFTRKKDGNRPLLGREKEIRVFQAALQGFVRHREGHVVMYKGSTGYGKSRLIVEIDFLAREENHRGIALELSKVDIQESFYAILSLMTIVFGIDACRPYKRQDILQSKLTGLWEETFYCLLNNQFLVKFPMSAEVSHMDNETKQKEEEMLYLRVPRKVKEATLVFIIDEAQYMDAASWDFLAKLLLSVPIFIVLSLSPFASKELLPCASAQGIMKSPKTAGVVLQELEPSKLLEMALSVGLFPFFRFLIQRSSGVPLYCEALLMDLHANEVLEFYHVPEEDKEEDEWDNLPSTIHLLNSSKSHSSVPKIAVAQLDSLSPSEQMAVKCAALIGHTFTPELLLYILSEWTNKEMEETLMSLINFHVFECFGKEARATQAELWLGDQKKALHLKCASFLEHKAHKCRSCGGGDFISFHRYALNTQMSNVDSAGTAVMPSLLSHYRVEQEFLDRVDKMIKYHKRGKEEATNLAPCECGERVESVVSALARHCLMVNDRTRAFYYLLESAAASLYLSNNYMVTSGLQELSALAVFPCLKRPKLKINQFEEATFCSLRGEVCFNMGQIALAKKLIKRALCLLHKGFSRTWLGAFFQSLLEESKHSAYHTQQCQGIGKALAVLQQQIHCLSLFWQLYSLDSTANRKYSRLAALMEINLADVSENKMQIILTYMDFSQFSQSMGYKDEWLKYEMMAIQRSSQYNFTFTRERLLMTAQLAQTLAYSKLYLGHLTRSIQLGESILTVCWEEEFICINPHTIYTDICILSSTGFQVLFCRYAQCVRVLEWLWELATQEESIIVLACFYSACLDLLLCDAGFDYRPIEECLQFINQYEASCILKSQSNILLSLYSSLAIWFGRLQHWDLFEDNFTKAQWLVSRTNVSLFGTHGFFRFLECQGLLLRRVMEDMPEKVRETRSSTLRVIFLLCQSQCICKGRTGNNQAWSEQVLCMHSSSTWICYMPFSSSPGIHYTRPPRDSANAHSTLC
uniref:Orc1-like AAA ATPase domain-containing protein n=1 Tax=Gopherus evgoodei TaxID=1825980 RepID=A0A8C4VNK0_9SAUR